MNSITQNNEKEKRYLPHDLKTRIHAVEAYRKSGDISYTCRKYHISRISLWRWNKKYDGTPESLADKSHRPNTRHPNAHTNQEIRWIRNYVRRNPKITLNELWYKLKREKGYTRKITSTYRVMKRLNIKFYEGMKIKDTSKRRHNKHYETPKDIGEKWQIDVKYVPNECKTKDLPDDKRFYQYTCIDEASRERFYVMALNDIEVEQNEETCDWYNDANGNMSTWETDTSRNFGTGNKNTSDMIAKWNSTVYGQQDKCQDHKDLWGQITTQVEKGWFVPSKEEWSAFGEELSIDDYNYLNFGLKDYYWSSSQKNTSQVWCALFYSGCMSDARVNENEYVRLSTIF